MSQFYFTNVSPNLSTMFDSSISRLYNNGRVIRSKSSSGKNHSLHFLDINITVLELHRMKFHQLMSYSLDQLKIGIRCNGNFLLLSFHI